MPGEIAILGEEGTKEDRGGGWSALEDGDVERLPPLKIRCPELEPCGAGWNCETGTMLYPASPRWLTVCGTTDGSVTDVGATFDCGDCTQRAAPAGSNVTEEAGAELAATTISAARRATARRGFAKTVTLTQIPDGPESY